MKIIYTILLFTAGLIVAILKNPFNCKCRTAGVPTLNGRIANPDLPINDFAISPVDQTTAPNNNQTSNCCCND